MILPKLKKGQKRKISIFFASLGVAMLLWVLYSLSNRYTYPATLFIKWTDIPQEIKANTNAIDTLEARIEGSGWHLIFNRFQSESREISISLHALKGKNYLALNPLLKQLSKQLPEGQQLIAIQPDSIHFNRSTLISKKVPVKLYHRLSFMPFYGLSDSLQITPGYVTIKGTPQQVQNIHFATTEIMEADALNNNLERVVKLRESADATYRFYPNLIKVNVPVGQYTEKVIELELQVKHKPAEQRLSLYPARIKLTLSTALGNYADIGPEDFEAFVDLQNMEQKDLKRLPVKFGRMPNFIKAVKIDPQTVDFIIYP